MAAETPERGAPKGLIAAWRARSEDPDGWRRAQAEARYGPTLHPGEIVADRYHLVRHAGDGPLAATWAARDLVRKQSVGLKVLHGQHAADRGARAAFDRASGATGGPVEVVDRGGVWEGFHWFATEGEPGRSLHGLVVTGEVGPAVALELVVEAGQALAALHGAGGIHGLVSPDTIRMDDTGQARLHDAGLVTPTAAMGVAWLAPERLDPSEKPGAAADVYGLAMSLLFALNGGELPFWAWRDPERLVATLEPPAPAERALRTAVAWDPAARTVTVQALLDAVLEAPSLRRSLAEACLQTGRPQAALDHLEELRRRGPDDPELLADRARALDALEAPSAEFAWQEALDAHHTRHQARAALEALFERSDGRMKVARGRALLPLLPVADRPALQLRMGQVLLDAGDAEGALPLLEDALDGGADDPALPALVDRLQTERGDWADVMTRLVRRAREESPAEHLRHALAIARYAIRDDLLPLQAALIEHEDDPESLRAEILAVEERGEDPSALLERLAATGAESAADRVRRADWRARTDPAGAEALLGEGLAEHPGHLGLIRALARCQTAAGRLTDARALWDRVAAAVDGLGLEELDREHEHARADLALRLGDVVEAATLWHRRLDADADDRRAWWGLTHAAWRAPEDAPWIGATPAVFTPEEALARLLSGLLDRDAVVAWLAGTPRGAAGLGPVADGSRLALCATLVDELEAGDGVGPPLFEALADHFSEAVLAIEAVRWLWCEPASEPLFAIPDCYRWSGLTEAFDQRLSRRVLHLESPRSEGAEASTELFSRGTGPLPIEAAWRGGTPVMATDRPLRTVVTSLGRAPLELDGTRHTIGGGREDNLRFEGLEPSRVVFERVGEVWYLRAHPPVLVEGQPTSERRVLPGQRIVVEAHGFRVHRLPQGAPVPDETDDVQLDPPEDWPTGVHAVLVHRWGRREDVLPFVGDVLALGPDPYDPEVDPDSDFLYKLVRTETGYTLEDRSVQGSELPAVLPLQHGDAFAIGDRTFTFERQGISEVPTAITTLDPKSLLPLLLYREGGHETVIPVLDDVFSIGRGGGNDLQLPDDPEISRHHCMLVRGTDGACILRDSGSANGTYVNGRPVERHILQVGDVIQAGTARLVFQLGRRDEVEANLPDMLLEEIEETPASRAETAAFRRPVRR